LDIGIERNFINNQTKRQQEAKISDLRKKVSDMLAKSSGLGL
jgi:hypothetical protein